MILGCLWLDVPVFTVGRLSSPPYFMYGDIDTIEIAANRLSGDLMDLVD